MIGQIIKNLKESCFQYTLIVGKNTPKHPNYLPERREQGCIAGREESLDAGGTDKNWIVENLNAITKL